MTQMVAIVAAAANAALAVRDTWRAYSVLFDQLTMADDTTDPSVVAFPSGDAVSVAVRQRALDAAYQAFLEAVPVFWAAKAAFEAAVVVQQGSGELAA